jgi:hypothetical protein
MSAAKDAKGIAKMVGEDMKSDFNSYGKLLLGVLLISGIEILAAVLISVFSKFDLIIIFPLVMILSNFSLMIQIRKIRDEMDELKKENDF